MRAGSHGASPSRMSQRRGVACDWPRGSHRDKSHVLDELDAVLHFFGFVGHNAHPGGSVSSQPLAFRALRVSSSRDGPALAFNSATNRRSSSISAGMSSRWSLLREIAVRTNHSRWALCCGLPGQTIDRLDASRTGDGSEPITTRQRAEPDQTDRTGPTRVPSRREGHSRDREGPLGGTNHKQNLTPVRYDAPAIRLNRYSVTTP